MVRFGEPKAEGTYVLHEGPYGVFNGSLKEFGYSDFKDNKQQKLSTTGGWVGITDKYWMATLVPDQKDKVEVTVKGTGALPNTKFQVDYVGQGVTVAPGASGEQRCPSVRRRQDRQGDRRLREEVRHREASTSPSTGAGSGSSPSRCSGCSSGCTPRSAISAWPSWC